MMRRRCSSGFSRCCSLPVPLLGAGQGIRARFELERRGDYASRGRHLPRDSRRQAHRCRGSPWARACARCRSIAPAKCFHRRGPRSRPAPRAGSSTAWRSGCGPRLDAAGQHAIGGRALGGICSRRTRCPTGSGGRPRSAGRPEERRQAYSLGRERLNRPDALAAERAQLAGMDGDYAAALREWLAGAPPHAGFRD